MGLHYISILENSRRPAIELCVEYDLSEYSHCTRHEYIDLMRVISQIVAERTAPNRRRSIEENGCMIHCFARSEGFAAVIISKDYPSLAVHAILSKVMDEFIAIQGNGTPITQADVESEDYEIETEFPALRKYLCNFQDPSQVNNISAIQRDLDENKILKHRTLNAVLERGQKIDDLIANSSDLHQDPFVSPSCDMIY
ncbi:snare-like protein [Xylaria telfairii]|nr:snare-like protein [Xylaria telfairii]